MSYALRETRKGTTVVCASSGNFGQAVSYVGRARGPRVRVHPARNVNPAKRSRMAAFGAEVVDTWPDMPAARSAAADAAANAPAVRLIMDGVDPTSRKARAPSPRSCRAPADWAG